MFRLPVVLTIAGLTITGCAVAGAEMSQQPSPPLTSQPQTPKVRSVTYQVESDGRPISVVYDTSTSGGVSSATATGVKSGWKIDVQHSGIVGPFMSASLDPDLHSLKQNPGTVRCRIFIDGKQVAEQTATGEYATASCNAFGM